MHLRLDLGGFFEAEAVGGVGFRGDCLGFHFEFPLEDAVDDASARAGSAAAERKV